MDLYNIRKKLNMGYLISSFNLKVTFYARVSTDHLDQQNSLQNQKIFFEDFIQKNSNWQYVKGYYDEGISGTSINKRESFLKMIEDAKNGQFDLIITKEISRFSRNTLDSIKYTRLLLLHGVGVLFLNDNINTILPDSELRLTIMASMAQDEIRRLSERVKFGMNQAIKKGVILGNDMLYGYKKDVKTGNLVIIAKEAFVVKKIYNLYVFKNLSINKIVRLLNKEGYKTRSNHNWCTSTISRMMQNYKYKGYYCGKKSEIIDYMTKKIRKNSPSEWILYKDEIKIPPIIDEKLWDLANKKIKRFKSVNTKNSYPLTGKIYCDNDNHVFYRRKNCVATKDVSWFCSMYLQKGKQKCNSPNIRESEVVMIVDNLRKMLNIKISDVKKVLDNWYQAKKIIVTKETILSFIIEHIIDKIIVKNVKKDCISLCVYLNLSSEYNFAINNRKYAFLRGYEVSNTRRYKVYYQVKWKL